MFTSTQTLYDDIGFFALKGVVIVQRWSTPYQSPSELCIHKYTDIYDGIGLFTLKGVVTVQRGSTLSLSCIVFTNAHL